MKVASIIVFILITNIALAQKNSSYYSSFLKLRNDFNNMDKKKIVSGYLSTEDNPINPNNIDKVTFCGNVFINDCENIDAIEVSLKNTPTVLKKKYLIFVNHKNKEITHLNLDYYLWIKTDPALTGYYVAVVNNFRGDLQLLIYKFLNDRLTPIFISNIRENIDCFQYKYNSLRLENRDINKDGKLDLVIYFDEYIFCNDDGQMTEHKQGERGIERKILYKAKLNRDNWTEQIL